MNISQIKASTTIQDYLEKQGIEPVRVYKNYLWYRSPFHADRNPSFLVNVREQLWNDVSTNSGGDLIDLAKCLHKTDTAGAIKLLTGYEVKKYDLTYYQQTSVAKIGDKLFVTHSQEIKNRALVEYLFTRRIPLDVARRFLVECYFRIGHQKQSFAIGMKNDSGGYALRNKYRKFQSTPADITTIPGNDHSVLNLFEGMTDFVSAIVYFRKPKELKHDTIILNSLSHLPKVLPLLSKYEGINLFFDNDRAGIAARNTVQNLHPKTEDFAKRIYPGHKDFNEFLCSRYFI